jgi:tetratricopeptide (TPR) repeat protein
MLGGRLRIVRPVMAAWLALWSAGCANSETSPASAAEAEPAIGRSTLGSYLAARQAERDRDYSNAARFIMAALEREPENFDLLNRAHLLLIEDGKFDEAVAVAHRILRLSPNSPQANLTLAVADSRDRNFARAQARLSELPLTGVNRVILPLLNAWLETAQERPAAALNALRPLGEVSGFRPLYEYHAALITDMTGRPDLAEGHYRKAIETEEGASVRQIEAIGRFYERQNRVDDARALYARYQTRFPESMMLAAASARAANGAPPPALVATPAAGMAEALFNLASVFRQESGGQLALVYGRLALALTPDVPLGLLLVGEVLDGQGRRAEANELFNRIPRSSPLAWSARLRVAQNLYEVDDVDGAVRDLRAMASERPDRIDALLVLGTILRSKERHTEAVQVYDQAIARTSPVEARHWSLFYSRGISLERSKQWSRAEADFLKALELQPEQPDVMNYLAYSWVEQGLNYERAQKMLERAVELRPNAGHIVDSLGWVLYRTGKVAESVPVLERAVELVPDDPTLLDHLGDALWRVGRREEARFQWKRSLQSKPEPELKTQLERKLRDGLPPVPATARGI